MRLPVPFAIVSLLLISAAGFCPRVNSQTLPVKKNPGTTVSGKVTIKGKPAPGIVVGIRSSRPAQFDPTFKATTDQEGNYRVTDVPGGSFEVAPVAPALVISDANNARGQTVIVNESENIDGIDFELTRGGVITGKVTDADGHPVIEERVNLLPVDQNNQRRPVSPLSVGFQTDDRGVYRVFGIPAGRYKVSIGDGENGFYRGITRGRPASQTTFYPDVTDPAKATIVDVDEGTEAANINITMAQVAQGFSVSGRVVDGESGKPVANVAIGLSVIVTRDTGSSSYGSGTNARSDTQGEFHLEKLPPGKYSITIYPAAESDLRAEPLTFDVLDQDVTGILIKTVMGASVSGSVVLESGKNNSAATAAMAQAYVAAYVRSEGNVNSGHSSRLSPDGTFRVGGLQAGTANFSIDTFTNLKGLTISRVERNGVVQPNGIQIQNTEQVTGIRIVVAYSSGSIRGVVKVENGPLPSGGRLLVQLIKPGEANGRMQASLVDARGHFLIEGLAAGNYELVVMAYLPDSRLRTPPVRQVVTVNDGAPTDVTVTVDLATTPNQP